MTLMTFPLQGYYTDLSDDYKMSVLMVLFEGDASI